MSLKDLTAPKHKEAESTNFMRAVFDQKLPHDLWVDWTRQKSLFYNAIEYHAEILGLLDDLRDIKRSFFLMQDYSIMNNSTVMHSYRPVVLNYCEYLDSIKKDESKILAHLYTWHMGDMFGGQMIKKIVPGSHLSLEFENTRDLMVNLRSKLSDNLADEANVAFDWAIKMMRDYDRDLEQNN